MKKIPSMSEKELLVLKMLINEGRELYGLEMVEQSNSLLKRGTVYTTLARMEEKGYIESRKESIDETEAKAPRRLYKPSGLGERVCSAHEVSMLDLSGVMA